MEFQIPIRIQTLPDLIAYPQRILLTGSCFTEHIGNHLLEAKFDVLQNPHGILFDPYSVASGLVACIQNRKYSTSDLVYFNELWHSWQHHGIFSNMDSSACLDHINGSLQTAHDFLQKANWLVITLGSSFSYRLADSNQPVANCHRAPASTFVKHLMTIEETNTALDNCIHQLFGFNPQLRIIFTISPVRHIRDGVVDNNRSKARLIEAVHHLASKFDRIYYFPAYELLIDVLRDYRFYDIDLVHPNYQATDFVLEKFSEHCIEPASRAIMQEVKKIAIARKHRPFQPKTQAHRQFLLDHLEKLNRMKQQYPFLDLEEEISYFSSQIA